MERDAIAALMADARTGRSRVLVLRGEAGIGKSTLLRDAVDHADGLRLLHCAGVESEVAQAFSGLHQLLRPVLHHLDALPDTQARALRGALGLTDSAASDFLVSAALVTLLAHASEQEPLLVVVDDLQWVDRASTAALLFAARRLVAEPIALLLAVRDSTVDITDLPALTLTGLTGSDAALLLVEHGWARSSAPLLAATGGNPLALVELAGHDDPDRLVADLALTGTVPLGARVRKAFLRRVDALPPTGRELLLVAAAEETGDTGTVLGACARLGIAADALVEVEQSGLLEVVDAELRFRHPLVRSAVYAEATFHRRRAAHLAIAEQLDGDRSTWHRAVAATRPDEELAAALENSATAARRRGGEAAAVAVLRRAARLSETSDGRRARTVFAAFCALDSGQPELARTLVDEVMAEPVPAVTLAQLNGTIELYAGDPAVAYTHLMRCAELLASADPEEAAWTFLLASSAAFSSGTMADAAEAVGRIADLDCSPATKRAGAAMNGGCPVEELWELPGELARSQPEGGGRPWMWAAVIGWLGPHPRAARKLAEVAGQRLRAAGATAGLTELLFYQADIGFRLGLWPEGVAYAEEGLRFSYETGQRGWTANLLAALARFAALRGDTAECRRYADRALAIAVPLRHRAVEGLAHSALGLSALGEGQYEAALAALSEVDVRSYGALAVVTETVEAAVRTGRAESVRGLVDQLGEVVDRLPWVAERVHQCRALLAEDAEPHHLLALAAEGGEDRAFSRARSHLLYGEWLRRNHRAVDARVQLRTAAESFDHLGAAPWARRAETELRAAGGGAVRLKGTAALLTPQELEVAQLAAAGLSNREIGARLHLSPRTVGSHLYRMFPKLGFTSRAQLRGLDFG